jgi:hypothetical protein
VTDGLGDAALVGQDSPQVIMGFREVGLQAERFPILLERFLRLPLSAQGIPQINMRLIVSRPQADRFGIIARRLGKPVLLCHDHAQGIVSYKTLPMDSQPVFK